MCLRMVRTVGFVGGQGLLPGMVFGDRRAARWLSTVKVGVVVVFRRRAAA